MLKISRCTTLFLFGFFFTGNAYSVSEQEQWQQFRAQQGMSELDAQFDTPTARPEVRVEVVEKIIEVEKVVIKEVPVPATPVEPTPVADTPTNSSDVVVESDGYVFTMKPCQMSHRNIKCKLSVLNPTSDGELSIYSTRGAYSSKLFDRSGNEYHPSRVSIGNKSDSSYIRNQYIEGVTAKGSLAFENIEKSTQSIALIDLSYYDHKDKNYKHIKFRDVGLEQ